MPYLNKDLKEIFDDIGFHGRCESGTLNYGITTIIIEYMEIHGLSYQTCNDIVGALDNAKDEFQRRVQHPYEDRKILENGDVYPSKFLNGGM